MSLKHMRPHPALALKQKGVVLLITLIVLVAMTLAAISLIRSVDTTNVIAGNLAFHSAATDASDIGIADASVLLNSIFNTNQGALLNCTPGIDCQAGYLPKHEPYLEPPYANTTWNSYWNNVSAFSVAANGAPAGYTVNYIIQRMCQSDTGTSATCFSSVPVPSKVGCSKKGSGSCPATTMTYYRVTVRTAGPRNTVSFVQSILAM